MTTLTGTTTRTITGYLVTLLEYPRWLIEREVDFTNCHLHGDFDAGDTTCVKCRFGDACRWLHSNRDEPTLTTPVSELIDALATAVDYVREHADAAGPHVRRCDCDTCGWLHEAQAFLRTHRHRS